MRELVFYRLPLVSWWVGVLQYHRKGVKQVGKYKRGRQARWDRRNLVTVSTHVSREQAARFRKACAIAGATPYHVLREFIMSYHDAPAVDGQKRIKESS